MKKKDVKTWIRALRSGEYMQCQKKLHDGKGFCCLGVMIDVLVDGDWQTDGEFYQYKPSWWFDGSCSYPSKKVLQGLGLTMATAQELARRNDDGESFGQIADWIEGHADELCKA